MKSYLAALSFFIITPAFAFSENANNEILYLTKPYTITHLSSFDIDCVWTKDEQGRLRSEAAGPDGSGVCWDEKAVDQVEKLDKEKKLIWRDPPKFDYEYGNKNKCYYMVDKIGGFVNYRLGKNITEAEADECRKDSNKEKALSLATKVEKKVEFGGYVATENNILGSVVLACYIGSLDSDGMLVSKAEQDNRYKALLGLYEGDRPNIKRINNAFNFARRNLSDRYPLDTRGQYRADVCDQLVLKGKL